MGTHRAPRPAGETAPSARPAPRLAPSLARPADPAAVLDRQRSAGNAAVQRWLDGTATVVARQPVPPVYTAEPGEGAAPPPAASPQAAAPTPLSGATPLEQAVDGFTRATPETVNAAWAVLFAQAMYDLLPVLEGLRARGFWSTITTDAGPRGGLRLETAVVAVNLKAALSPITPDMLRSLVDQMAGLPADQRADVLRYLGKYVVIPVDGIDLDLSYVAGVTTRSCVGDVEDLIAEAKSFIAEFRAAGADPANKTIPQVNAAVRASVARRGQQTEIAGSTSATGVIKVSAARPDKSGPIEARSTRIHEEVHDHRRDALSTIYKPGTPEFDAAWNDAKDYVPDEIKARNAEIAFLRKVLVALRKLETML